MAEPTFFLHHYESSPYAEKIRLMFGYAGARWGSVLSPMYPPRPNVDPLAGGYRRIPVAQLGADIFCDTALIAAEIADHTGRAALAPVVTEPEAAALVARAEGEVFFAGITSVPPLKLLTGLVVRMGPLGALKFARDRAGMLKGGTVRPPQGAAAMQVVDGFLDDLEAYLAGHSALDVEGVSYADFCVYHPIWLATAAGHKGLVAQRPAVQRWMGKMEGLGHGSREDMRPEQAFAEAEGFAPRGLPDSVEDHPLLGATVAICPSDYARVPVAGTLAAVAEDRFVIARDTDRFGVLHVHFPRAGYEVSPA